MAFVCELFLRDITKKKSNDREETPDLLKRQQSANISTDSEPNKRKSLKVILIKLQQTKCILLRGESPRLWLTDSVHTQWVKGCSLNWWCQCAWQRCVTVKSSANCSVIRTVFAHSADALHVLKDATRGTLIQIFTADHYLSLPTLWSRLLLFLPDSLKISYQSSHGRTYFIFIIWHPQEQKYCFLRVE